MGLLLTTICDVYLGSEFAISIIMYNVLLPVKRLSVSGSLIWPVDSGSQVKVTMNRWSKTGCRNGHVCV